MKNYQQMLPPLLEADIKVLIYAGDCGEFMQSRFVPTSREYHLKPPHF